MSGRVRPQDMAGQVGTVIGFFEEGKEDRLSLAALDFQTRKIDTGGFDPRGRACLHPATGNPRERRADPRPTAAGSPRRPPDPFPFADEQRRFHESTRRQHDCLCRRWYAPVRLPRLDLFPRIIGDDIDDSIHGYGKIALRLQGLPGERGVKRLVGLGAGQPGPPAPRDWLSILT